MRESLARAVNSKNLQQKEHNCQLDLVHALGKSAIHNPIGVKALHVIDGLQPQGYKDLVYSLSLEARKRIKCDKKILLMLCKQVIHETAFSFCKVCSGRKQAIIESKVILCGGCNGTGLRRHTDLVRSKSIGVSEDEYVKHWANRFSIVQSIFTSDYKNALSLAKLKIIG